MLDALNFVKGAVAKKDYVPELSHFQIKHGRVTGFNGQMTLSSPIDLDIQANPKAMPFVKAVNACHEQIAIHITKAGRLAIKSGKFKAYIECLPDDGIVEFGAPDGEDITVGENFVAALKTLGPFQGQDASRPWAHGIMFKGQSAYATNNICMVEYWHGHQFPFAVNIPKNAIVELLRIKQDPIRVQLTERSVTFHFEGDRWLRTVLLADNWPDIAGRIFDKPADPQPVPDEVFETLDELKPFLDDTARVFFKDGVISTSEHDETGSSVDTAGIVHGPCFHHSQLVLLRECAEKIDFTSYPAPCKFTGDRVRGVVLGMKY